MSRKIIRDFIKQADKLDNEQAARYFDRIMEVYEDSVHTPDERIAHLETETLWLLVEYRKIVEAKDNTPEVKQQHRTAQRNLSVLLSGLIASTADKGIYLSEAFIKKYENVDFVSVPFGDFVRDVYNVRKWQSPEPQQKGIAAPQQPNNGSSGELAGNGNESATEGKQQPQQKSTTTNFRNKIAGNVDSDKLLAKLHTLMDGKTGKEALIYLTICIIDGKINRPTFKQFEAEFPYICKRANYYRYTNPKYYTKEEKEAARKALDRNK